MFTIYRATSPTNKTYVGFTSKSLVRRKCQHLSAANTGSNYAFHRALRKYGDQMKWEILGKVQTLQEAHELEKRVIGENRSFGVMGYNMTIGGEGQAGASFSHSEEARKKISLNNSKFWLGKHRSEETKKKLSNAQKGVPKGPISEEHRNNLRLAALNRYAKQRAA